MKPSIISPLLLAALAAPMVTGCSTLSLTESKTNTTGPAPRPATIYVANQPLTEYVAEDFATKADHAIQAFEKANPGLTNFFDRSVGFAVFPSVGKGGFIIGGEHGKGLVYEQGRPIGQATLTGVNLGAQVGGQSFSAVVFFETAEALANFKQNRARCIISRYNINARHEMSTELSAVASSAGASKDARYQDGVALFTLPKTGLMVQATVGSQNLEYKPWNHPEVDAEKYH
jgi:lipid-binding SYLF domain-containing protein